MRVECIKPPSVRHGAVRANVFVNADDHALDGNSFVTIGNLPPCDSRRYPGRRSESIERSWRPGVRLLDEPVSLEALHPGFLRRLFGARPAAAVLPPVTSKYGGVPYVENLAEMKGEDGGDMTFIGQLNFAEFPTEGTDLPEVGLLVVYVGTWTDARPWPFRWRWYRAPDPGAALSVPIPRCMLSREHRITGQRAGSFPVALLDTLAARDPLFESLHEWLESHGANCGTAAPFGADHAGPLEWYGRRPADNTDLSLVWTPADGEFGNFEHSLVIARDAMRRGEFDEMRMASWQ